MDNNGYDAVVTEEISISALPVIDNQFKRDLEINKVAMTRQLFSLFVSTLLKEQRQIDEAHHNKEYKLLHDFLHSLNGAACYCGVPRLKETIVLADRALQNSSYDKLAKLLIALDGEIKLVMNYAKQAGFEVGLY